MVGPIVQWSVQWSNGQSNGPMVQWSVQWSNGRPNGPMVGPMVQWSVQWSNGPENTLTATAAAARLAHRTYSDRRRGLMGDTFPTGMSDCWPACPRGARLHLKCDCVVVGRASTNERDSRTRFFQAPCSSSCLFRAASSNVRCGVSCFRWSHAHRTRAQRSLAICRFLQNSCLTRIGISPELTEVLSVGCVKRAMAATLANYDSSNQRKVLGIVRTVKDEVLLGLMLVMASFGS